MIAIKKVTPGFTDARGEITDLLVDVEVRHTGLISSNAKTIRGDHYRNNQQHNYVVTGKAKIVAWNPTNPAEKTESVVTEGDLIYIPPNIAYRMEFLEDTLLIYFNSAPRIIDGKEANTVKVKYPFQ